MLALESAEPHPVMFSCRAISNLLKPTVVGAQQGTARYANFKKIQCFEVKITATEKSQIWFSYYFGCSSKASQNPFRQTSQVNKTNVSKVKLYIKNPYES